MADLFNDSGTPKPVPKNGTRLENSGWSPSDQDRSFATMCKLDPDRIWAEFQDYWTAKTGADATKKDWAATWRNWCRRAEDMNSKRSPGRFQNNAAPADMPANHDLTQRWVGGRSYSWCDALSFRQRARAGQPLNSDERAAMEAWGLHA